MNAKLVVSALSTLDIPVGAPSVIRIVRGWKEGGLRVEFSFTTAYAATVCFKMLQRHGWNVRLFNVIASN